MPHKNNELPLNPSYSMIFPSLLIPIPQIDLICIYYFPSNVILIDFKEYSENY